MRRWTLWRWRGWQLALHQILRSDDDRAPHDHVGWNVSVLLSGCYRELVRHDHPFYDMGPASTYGGTYDQVHLRWPLRPYFRQATRSHRLILKKPVWTLWLRGPKVREWGFHCPQGWVHWTRFTSGGKEGYSSIGKGCD